MATRRWVGIAAFIVVSLLFARAARAQTTPVTVGSWQTLGGYTPDTGYGMCLENDCGMNQDVTGCIKEQPCAAPGTSGTYAYYEGQDPQQWAIDSHGEIRYQHGGSDTGLCLTLYQGNASQGELVLETCSGFNFCSPRYGCNWIANDSQTFQWVPDSNINGHIEISALELTYYPGYCLDVHGGNANAGTLVDIASCNGTQAQVWSPLYYTFLLNSGVASNICWDTYTGSSQCIDDPNLFCVGYVTNTCNTSSATQQFTFIPYSGGPGYYHDYIASENFPDLPYGNYVHSSWWGPVEYPYGPPYPWGCGPGSDCYGGAVEKSGANTNPTDLVSQIGGWLWTPFYQCAYPPGGDCQYTCLEVWQNNTSPGAFIDYDACATQSGQVWKLNVLGMP